MKLHQLRYINEVDNQALNVSDAADVLHTSQPGVSKQIRLLEDELGVPIFTRDGKRLTEVTTPGKEILPRVRSILREIEYIRRIGHEYRDQRHGTLTIATTHTQARYALPSIVKSFSGSFPNVKLTLKQGYPEQITELVLEGKADIVIATESVSRTKEIVALPCYRWNHCVLVLPDHPLAEKGKRLSLEDIAFYPLVTYDFAFAGRTMVSDTFSRAGLQPNIVFTALDSDVIKTYVELGMGIGLVATMAYDAKRDKALRQVDAGHLFESSTTWIGVRRGSYLRGFVYDFIETFAPHLDRTTVKAALHVV